MKYLRPLAVILLGFFLTSGVGSGPVPRRAPTAQDETQKKEIRVWVNTNSGIYHCPATRWYGKTKQGKYMVSVKH
jgi:hypothetical protein